VSYFAAAVVKDVDGWSAAKVSLAGAADVEDVADRMRDVEPVAEISLLFVEADETYLAILRLDYGEDLRIFGSDVAFAEESRLGALLLGDLAGPTEELASGILDVADFGDEDTESDSDSDEEPEAPAPAVADPTGDVDLLTDLGLPATRLLELCGNDGMMPSDITAEVCQAIGCGDEVEELREV
jgi:putative tRNA adenosine deaminase-associated protein